MFVLGFMACAVSAQESCVGSSAALDPAQCAAWTELFDGSGGNGQWAACNATQYRLDPCSCRFPAQPAVVGCNGRDITEITLHKIGVVGTIPAALGSLTQLTFLNLPDNEISGTVPASFAALTKLAILSVGGNRLSGAIPEGLAQLTLLRGLDVQCNQFSGRFPLGIADLNTTCTLGGPANGACVDGRGRNRWSCPLPQGADQKCHASCQ